MRQALLVKSAALLLSLSVSQSAFATPEFLAADDRVAVRAEVTEVPTEYTREQMIEIMRDAARTRVDRHRFRAPLSPELSGTTSSTVDLLENIVNIIGGENGIGAWISIIPKIWKVIEDNKPVVNVSTKRVTVLPEESGGDWKKVTNWRGPVYKTFKVDIKNIYGGTLVSQKYTVSAFYGGKYKEAGSYLANVTVLPDASSSLFWNLDSHVEVGDIMNMGSEKDPVVGVDLQIVWKAKSVLQHYEGRESFVIRGDGSIEQITK